MDKTVNIAMFAVGLFIALGLSEASTKKGFSIEINDFYCGDYAALDIGNANWWYDWNLNPFYYDWNKKPNCPNHDLKVYDHNHIAMKWGKFVWTQEYWLRDSATVLLGFNEPNHVAQANMSPELAAKQWKRIEGLATSKNRNLPIGGPAAAPCGSPNISICLMDTLEWFDQFDANCSALYGEAGCRMDFTATHWYGCNSDWLMGFINKLYTRYGRPVWLTEFACPSADQTKVMEFMESALDKLEQSPKVEKYAWFVSRIKGDKKYVKPTASLLKQDSSELTLLGEYYVNYQASTTE